MSGSVISLKGAEINSFLLIVRVFAVIFAAIPA